MLKIVFCCVIKLPHTHSQDRNLIPSLFVINEHIVKSIVFMLRMGFSNVFPTQPKRHQMKFPLFSPDYLSLTSHVTWSSKWPFAYSYKEMNWEIEEAG